MKSCAMNRVSSSMKDCNHPYVPAIKGNDTNLSGFPLFLEAGLLRRAMQPQVFDNRAYSRKINASAVIKILVTRGTKRNLHNQLFSSDQDPSGRNGNKTRAFGLAANRPIRTN